MDYLRNHYIPKFLLKNFSEKAENGKWKINYINLGSRKVERRNLKAVFAQNNFYDIPSASDTKILEKRFNLKIETPMAQIVDKIISSNEGYITITRKELGIIKKFILIQMYRNPANQGQYQNASEKDSFTFSKAFKKESETDIDYWKREMLHVIEQEWDTLITQTDMPGVHQVANNIFTGYLTFFTTQNEFILADVPVFSERFPMEIQKNQEADFIKYARESSRSRGLSEEQAEANMRKEIREKSSYIENFFVVVLAPGLAIAVINVIWKLHYLYDGLNGRLHSPILGNPKNLKLPQTYYANKHMIKYEDEIKKYKNPKDQYRYNLIPLTQQETDYLMTLSLNESRLFIGFKNKESILRQVTIYNRLTKKELINLKINLQDIPNLINNFNYERDKG